MTAKVLVACETSGVVRSAFAAAGCDTWSCDLQPASPASNRHIRDDVRNVIFWDSWALLVVAHPPCTRLCNSGVRWLTRPPAGKTCEQMQAELVQGAQLFAAVWNCHVPAIAVENPVMHRHAKKLIAGYSEPAQTLQPWQFATDPGGPDNVKKRTCLWLKSLPRLRPTGTLDGSTARADIHRCPPGPQRSRIRSRFFPGLATAMATQWSLVI